MKWILLVGIALSADKEMGSFETEKACNEAADTFIEITRVVNSVAVCIDEKTAIALGIKEKHR